MGMSVGEEFDDFGNAPEILIEAKAIPAWEVLECGLIRLFVCKSVKKRLVLDHTDLITPDNMDAIGRRFLEISALVRAAKIVAVAEVRAKTH